MTEQTRTLEHDMFYKQAIYVMLFLLVARLIAMIWIPLNDSTESRYAEIARKMVETGNWLILQIDYGVPFWAKPPLSTWLSAFSIQCFGINEFAVRLPGLLLSFGVLFCIWTVAKIHSNKTVATAAVLFLSGCFYFFLDAGTVMTDPSLLFCTTLAMTSFWRGCIDSNRISAYLFFIALGLGLLAKGPIIWVLVGLPLFVWTSLHHRWKQLWQNFPWIKGTLLMALIAVPWYLMVEKRTPGFLNYFIVGEHLQRFLVSGWAGDKYGFAHSEPLGMIWIYIIIGITPWNIIGLVWIAKYWRNVPEYFRDSDGWMSFLFCWLLTPLLFFTFSSNIIYPYVFPVLPAYALILGEGWQRSMEDTNGKNWILWGATVSGIIFILATIVFLIYPDQIGKNHKSIVQAWQAQHPKPHSKLIFWNYGGYSGRFYSKGQFLSLVTTADLCRELSSEETNYVLVLGEEVNQLPTGLDAKGTLIHSVDFNGNKAKLMRFTNVHC